MEINHHKSLGARANLVNFGGRAVFHFAGLITHRVLPIVINVNVKLY